MRILGQRENRAFWLRMSNYITPRLARESKALEAGFTLRSFSTEGEQLDVVRKRLQSKLNFAQMASVGQVHAADVALVRSTGHVPAHDGLVTDQQDLLLTVIAADCALVLLADSKVGVIGACHAGWRGAVAGVVAKTIAVMGSLGANPKRTTAYIAPCIGLDRFEVGEEVAARFDPRFVRPPAVSPRHHVDLRGAVCNQLVDAGVSLSNIEVSTACTYTEVDRFYSYRAEEGTRGRMIGFIGMRPH
ncbi:peptidoglycan editing factor PgeF [soil metagenome]